MCPLCGHVGGGEHAMATHVWRVHLNEGFKCWCGLSFYDRNTQMAIFHFGRHIRFSGEFENLVDHIEQYADNWLPRLLADENGPYTFHYET